MKTKLKKKILTFILIFNVLTLSFVPCVNTYKTEAAAAGAATVANITGYILSILGATDMLTNGGVRGVSGSVIDAIKAKVSEKLGSGIYVDSNGDYVFSNEATQDIYDILNNSANFDARVISNFGSQESVINSSYISSQMLERIVHMDNGSPALYVQGTDNSGYIWTFFIYAANNNIAYLLVSPYSQLTCYDANLNSINATIEVAYCTYIPSAGTYSTPDGYTSRTKSNLGVNIDNLNTFDAFFKLPHFTVNDYKTSVSYSMSQSVSLNNAKWSIRSFHSLMLAKSNQAASNLLNQDSGIVYNTTNYNIPKISESVINNNDWNSIYNSYITNVQQNYTSSDTDINKLRQVMKTYTDNLINTINTGNDNILQQILDTNGWLSEIYNKIDAIYTYLTDMQSGGGSSSDCPWTSEQIESMLDWLEDIEGNTADIGGMASDIANIDSTTSDSYTQILAMKTLLQQILSALQNGGSGGSGGTPSSPSYTIPNTKVPWDDLDDLTTQNVTDYIDNADIIENLLEDTMLVASIMLIGNVINGLASDPVTPHWTIPFQLTSSYTGADIDEDFDIDFNDFDFTLIHNVLIGGQVIIFTILCAWMFLNLLKLVIDLFF